MVPSPRLLEPTSSDQSEKEKKRSRCQKTCSIVCTRRWPKRNARPKDFDSRKWICSRQFRWGKKVTTKKDEPKRAERCRARAWIAVLCVVDSAVEQRVLSQSTTILLIQFYTFMCASERVSEDRECVVVSLSRSHSLKYFALCIFPVKCSSNILMKPN